MISRRHLVAGAVATLALPAKADTTSLRELAAARGLIFGSAAASYELKDADFVAALTRDAAQLVPEPGSAVTKLDEILRRLDAIEDRLAG